MIYFTFNDALQQFVRNKNDDSFAFVDRVLLTIRSNGEAKQYTLSEALKFVEEIKEKHQKVNYANQSYRKCVEVLYSINEHNRRLISRWNLNEEHLLNLRNYFWKGKT